MYVEEREGVGVLPHDIRGDLLAHDLTEETVHA
jgi:hypothetical protein